MRLLFAALQCDFSIKAAFDPQNQDWQAAVMIPAVRIITNVAAKQFAVFRYKASQTRAADLLLAFKEVLYIDRQISFYSSICFPAFDMGEELRFVVRCAPAVNSAIPDFRLKRITGPLFEI